jgi:hypothetical protein
VCPIYRTGTQLPSKHPILYIFFIKYPYWFFLTSCALSDLFSSKCRLFHNATLFGSCIICILHTGCAKFLDSKFRCQNVKYNKWCTDRKKRSTTKRIIIIIIIHSPHLKQMTKISIQVTKCLAHVRKPVSPEHYVNIKPVHCDIVYIRTKLSL